MADELKAIRDLAAKHKRVLFLRRVSENFGQKEARELEDLAFKVSLEASGQERDEAFSIANGFREWAETYTG